MPDNHTILAIDTAATTGWAVRFPDGTFSSGIWKLETSADRRFTSPGMRFVRFRACLIDAIASIKPTIVAYESLQFATSIITAQLYGGFISQLQVVLDTHTPEPIPYVGIPVGTIKKFATGSGAANKELMIVAAKMRWPGFEPQTDDEADARWIAATAASELGLNEAPPPPQPKPAPRVRKTPGEAKKSKKRTNQKR